MPTNTHPPPFPPAQSGQPVRIDPDGWYTDADLRLALGLPGATLQRARRSGRLRHTRPGGPASAAWHLGAWVIAWLHGDEPAAAADGEATRV